MAKMAQGIAYRFGSLLLDCECYALIAADGSEIPLRPKSFALLQLMIEHPGRLLTKDAIMEALWPNLYVTENNITQCIHDIRSALGPDARQFLRTYSRRGYAFVGEVAVIRGARSATAPLLIEEVHSFSS